jgi:hypothetical protein
LVNEDAVRRKAVRRHDRSLRRILYMKTLIALAAIASLTGCGVETATTAATGAVIKKQEIEEGKKTMEQSQAKVEAAVQQMQQRAQKGGDP